VLEQTGGFDEEMLTGEDTELAERARAMGTNYVGAREVIVYHAIVERSLLGMVRDAWRWQHLPDLVRRHPRLRREFVLYVFWTRRHAFLPLAVAGWLGMKRSRFASFLTIPYLIHGLPRKYSPDPRGRSRALLDLPAWITIDVAEMLALAWGSIKHRTFFL
jgi:GT2 family glycosyltransferase